MHEQFWERLAGLSGEETAERAQCRYLAEDGSLTPTTKVGILRFRPRFPCKNAGSPRVHGLLSWVSSFAIFLLNTEYIVDPVRRTICLADESCQDRAVGYLQQLCILAYLVHTRDFPPAGQLVSVERLDPGGFFFRGSHRLPVEKLAQAFGSDPQRLHAVGRRLNAVERTFGDASIELLVLPRISVTLVVWRADEEFPARASVLFDRSATAQLPLDVLFAAAALTIQVVPSIVYTRI